MVGYCQWRQFDCSDGRLTVCLFDPLRIGEGLIIFDGECVGRLLYSRICHVICHLDTGAAAFSNKISVGGYNSRAK